MPSRSGMGGVASWWVIVVTLTCKHVLVPCDCDKVADSSILRIFSVLLTVWGCKPSWLGKDEGRTVKQPLTVYPQSQSPVPSSLFHFGIVSGAQPWSGATCLNVRSSHLSLPSLEAPSQTCPETRRHGFRIFSSWRSWRTTIGDVHLDAILVPSTQFYAGLYFPWRLPLFLQVCFSNHSKH